MSRLVTFGCSFTYGHGLEDCTSADGLGAGPLPSKFAWPSLVAEKMKLTCDNQSQCGLSNLGIVDKILNYTFTDSDVIVVMWTLVERDLIWLDKNIVVNLAVGASDVDSNLLDTWSTTHNSTDRCMRTWYNIHHAYSYLKSINANFHFLFARQDPEFMSLKPVWAESIKFFPVQFRNFRHLPLAADNRHPGTKSHSFMAAHIYQHINSPEFSNQS